MFFVLIIGLALFFSLFVAHLASQLADRMLSKDAHALENRRRYLRDASYARVLWGVPR
ncbi:MAG: hypothetical protein RLZ25_1200 [Pseudomonadota bacterium]